MQTPQGVWLVMNKYDFLKKWESYSGIRLIGNERDRFLKECDLILYLDDDILEMSLKVASQKDKYDLQYIETVGLHLRQYLHRVRYETIEGERTMENPSAQKTPVKRHLTLISGGKLS